MLIYIIIFALLLILAIIAPRRSKPYTVLIGFLLLGLMGLRDVSVGIDTRDYVEFFGDIVRANTASLSDTLSDSTEPFYVLLTWIIAKLTGNYTLYLLICSVLPAYAIYKLLYWSNTSKIQSYIGFLLLFVLGIGAFFLAGLRQTIAISIVVFSFFEIEQSRPLRFVLLVLCATLFHNSAVLFLIAYPLKKVRLNFLVVVGLVVAFYLVSLIDIGTLLSIATIFFNERFLAYEIMNDTLSTSGLIVQGVLFLFCFIRRKKLSPDNDLLLLLAAIAIVFQSMSTILAEMFRVSMYFSLFYIVLLPRAIKTYENKTTRALIEAGFCVIFLVYLFFISTTYLPDYKFAF